MKIKKRIISTFIVCVIALSLVACGDKEAENFSAMERNEKRDFVTNYLFDTYGIQTGITSDIKKEPSDSEYFHAEARTPSGQTINCWITDNKTVVDDKFLIDLTNKIDKTFADLIDNDMSPYRLSCTVEFSNPPSKKYNETEIIEMLKSNDVKVEVNILITREQRTQVNTMVSSAFDGKLNIANGNIYVYVVDNLESATFHGLDKKKCESSCVITVNNSN